MKKTMDKSDRTKILSALDSLKPKETILDDGAKKTKQKTSKESTQLKRKISGESVFFDESQSELVASARKEAETIPLADTLLDDLGAETGSEANNPVNSKPVA